MIKYSLKELNLLSVKSGVYKITNNKNNFCYIGSAGRQGIKKRIMAHLLDLKKNKHHSWILQRDWNNYKENDFFITILHICSPYESKKTEQKLIDKTGTGIKNRSYNILSMVDHSSLPADIVNKIKKSLRNPRKIISTNKSGYKGVCFYKKTESGKPVSNVMNIRIT